MKTRSPELEGFRKWMLKRGRSAGTAQDYIGQIALALESADVTSRLRDQRLAPNSRRLCKAALRAWARYSDDTALEATLVDLKLPPAENIRHKQPLTSEQWGQLRMSIQHDQDLNDAEKAAMLLIARRGLRVSAVTGLRRREVMQGRRDGVLVFHSKGRRLRYGIGPVAKQLDVLAGIRGWDVVGELICPNAQDPVRAARNRLWQLIRDQALFLGIEDMHPHRLRHTCATEFYRRNKDIRALQQYMQWADISTAARYVGELDRDELDALAEDMLDEVDDND